MKTIFLFTVLFFAVSARSQSLKEALFGGKLKSDTGAVIRQGDSLKLKESMAHKIAEDSVKAAEKAIADSMKVVQKMVADSIRKETIAVEKAKAIAEGRDTTAIVAALSSPEETATAEKTIPKDNNKIWKTFIDSLSNSVKSEVITSGKIKNGAYSVLIEYEIKPDGQVGINNVASDPKNAFLEQQVKDRLIVNAPQMNPVMGTNGKPRTVPRKQMLTFVK
jgi:hypothetical protein